MNISVIISTFNSPDWLEKVIIGYHYQTDQDFELVIADDGSHDETLQRIQQLRTETPLNIRHVWQEDDGFQKSRILNKAILASDGDYLLFSDGDCIPKPDFIAVHREHAEPGRFLSGGYVKLSMDASMAIGRDDIASGRCFDVDWLRQNGQPKDAKLRKLVMNGLKEQWWNRFTPTKPTWNGHNASGWKTDLIAVNGYNEMMQYGGQDREIGERLENAGIRGKQIRYSAICIHLDHKRGYVDREKWDLNNRIRKETRSTGRTWTADGILKRAKPA